MGIFGRVLKRTIRTGVQVGLSGFAAHYSGQPEYIAAAPGIAALGKLIREKWNWHWLPF